MAKIIIQGNASGDGILTIQAPNTDVDRTVTIPDASGTLLNAGSTLDATKLSGDLPAISGANLTGISHAPEGTAVLSTGETGGTKFLREDGDGTASWQAAGVTLDSPSITGTLSVDSGGNVSHTISNWSDDVTYVITPTNCTVGSINTSGVFVVTHTSGTPSYTIKATTDSLGLADSALVTKNIILNLSAPTISSPADVGTLTNVVYTITSTDSNDDKIILDMGSSNFNLGTVSPGSGTKSGNTVVVTGFTTGNPVVTIQFTAEATYSVTAKSVNIAGTYGDSASSSADSITIADVTYVAATGGTVTTDGDYKVHTFTGDGSFVVSTAGDVEYLVIGGGAGGGTNNGGGGGAGGYRTATGFAVTASTYSITVGAGGTGTNASTVSNSGGNSIFSTITSAGGGGAGGDVDGADGGSGGGGNNGTYTQGSGNTPSTSPSQGNDGGAGTSSYGAGGGGGAGSAGGAGSGGGNGGNGGAGLSSSITGSSVCRAGGGAGNGYGSVGSVTCGGGAGTSGTPGTAGNGTVNTGGGGGSMGNNSAAGGTGGSGIVIVRYQYQ